MLEFLKNKVLSANKKLYESGLVMFTWGNVSERDGETGFIVIKPSGVSYDTMTAEDMVVLSLNGEVVEGKLSPSSDAPTHLELYRNDPSVMGVAHTHSTFATAFAQAGLSIPCYGTTHADYFYGEIPCTRTLTREEVSENYEQNTGKVICETLKGRSADYSPACLVANHGVFSWGRDSLDAVFNAAVAEEVARMAVFTVALKPDSIPASDYLIAKHYFRKHGENAYYGQRGNKK